MRKDFLARICLAFEYGVENRVYEDIAPFFECAFAQHTISIVRFAPCSSVERALDAYEKGLEYWGDCLASKTIHFVYDSRSN